MSGRGASSNPSGGAGGDGLIVLIYTPAVALSGMIASRSAVGAGMSPTRDVGARRVRRIHRTELVGGLRHVGARHSASVGEGRMVGYGRARSPRDVLSGDTWRPQGGRLARVAHHDLAGGGSYLVGRHRNGGPRHGAIRRRRCLVGHDRARGDRYVIGGRAWRRRGGRVARIARHDLAAGGSYLVGRHRNGGPRHGAIRGRRRLVGHGRARSASRHLGRFARAARGGRGTVGTRRRVDFRRREHFGQRGHGGNRRGGIGCEHGLAHAARLGAAVTGGATLQLFRPLPAGRMASGAAPRVRMLTIAAPIIGPNMQAYNNFDPSDPGEQEFYGFNFARDLLAGETIVSASWSCATVTGDDPAAGERLQAAPTFVDTRTLQFVVGGVTYRLTATITTSLGQVLSRWAYVDCLTAN